MILIGEKINSSIPSQREMIDKMDTAALLSLAKAQADAGADYIDINAGVFLDREPELLAFMVRALEGKTGRPLSIDTPSYTAAQTALEASCVKGHMINSVTVEKDRLENMTRLAREHGCSVIALCMQDDGMPESTDSRLRVAGRLAEYLTSNGISPEDIFIDPMLRPLGADETSGVEALETIRRVRAEFPECHISVGLSNLSFGLPKRGLINRAFAVAAIAAGLDAAIANPLDKELMGLIAAAEAITGRDEYCLDFIDKARSGLI